MVHCRIKEGTLELSQQEVQRSSLLNYKGKGVAVVVICADLREDEEENPALPTAAITILQRSSKFKNLFDQLGLTANRRKIATKALVSIGSGVGVECLLVEIPDDRALLQESIEITFSNENMEVGYPDHRKPLYLAASINQIPLKRAWVDTSASVNLIPLSTLQAVGISKRKILGSPMEMKGFCRRGKYTVGHIQLWLKVGPIASLASVPCGENKGLLSCSFGEAMVAQTPISLIHLSLVCERKIEWQDDTHSSKPLVVRTSGGSFSRNYVLRPMGSVWGKLSIKATRYLCA